MCACRWVVHVKVRVLCKAYRSSNSGKTVELYLKVDFRGPVFPATWQVRQTLSADGWYMRACMNRRVGMDGRENDSGNAGMGLGITVHLVP